MKRITIIATTFVIANTLMATTTTSRASLNLLLRRSPPKLRNAKFFSSSSQFRPSTLPKSYSCPIWSSSFSFCLPPRSTSTSLPFRHFSSSPPSMSSAIAAAVSSAVSDESLISSNPLLQDFDFPPFDSVDAEHVRPGIRALLQHLEGELEQLEKYVEPSWPKLVEPLEKLVDRLSVVWGVINHLKAVKDTPELRAAIEDVQPEKVKFQLRLGQSKPIYNAFKAIRESPDWSSLSEARQPQIKEAVLTGIALDDEKREEFNKIEQISSPEVDGERETPELDGERETPELDGEREITELEKLSHKFSENVLDDTKKFEKLITDKKEMDGLPPRALGLFPQAAVSKGHENAIAENGPWVITLDAPSYFLVQHAKNRALREELYRAYLSRASSGDLDNTAIIDQILKLRLEKAKLLGYNNYAEVSMTMKMTIVEKAAELLEKLRSASWDPTVQDMEDLKNSAKSQCVEESDSLTHWDTTFWSERFRESKYDIKMSLAKTLFGVDIEPTYGVAPKIKDTQQWSMDRGGYHNGNDGRCGGGDYNNGGGNYVVMVMENEAAA
ncbi:hypothetical protein F2Q68_00003839 [Brassica cretica]|uniref:Peptidase M3A/M3B catalytic domain-containing protein n=1 Tax=Brassica cretica TaxID=69181 RepID=A0A8S9JKV2_BRACR|nr:hypothetical protein F2Q68_00003839 [Brassica cretica]